MGKMLKRLSLCLIVILLLFLPEAFSDELSDHRIEYAFAQKMQLDTIRILSAESDNRLVIEDLHFQDLVPTMESFSQEYYANFNDTLTELQINNLERDRLQYIYDREQQATLFSSLVPNALSIASVAYFSGFNLRSLIAIAGTALSSYSNYLTTKDQMELEYLQSNWNLDNEQKRMLDDLENSLYGYVCDIVVSLGMPRSEALSRDDLTSFIRACKEENPNRRYIDLKRMESRLSRLPDYWRELSKATYELEEYDEALDYIGEYETMYVPIFFHDSEYAEAMMIKASCLIETRSFNESLAHELEAIADKIQENISLEDWLSYFFCACLYQTIYDATSETQYAEAAFNCMYNVLSHMIEEYEQATADYLNLTFVTEGLELIDKELESANATLANEKATRDDAAPHLFSSNREYYNARVDRAQDEVDRLNEDREAFYNSIFTTLPPLDDSLIIAYQLYSDYAMLLGKTNSREFNAISAMMDEAIFYSESRELLFGEPAQITSWFMGSYGDAISIDFILKELPKLDSEELQEYYPVTGSIKINNDEFPVDGIVRIENYGTLDTVYLSAYLYYPDKFEVSFSKDTRVQPIEINYACDLFDILNPIGYGVVTEDVQEEVESRIVFTDSLSKKVGNIVSNIPVVNWFF